MSYLISLRSFVAYLSVWSVINACINLTPLKSDDQNVELRVQYAFTGRTHRRSKSWNKYVLFYSALCFCNTLQTVLKAIRRSTFTVCLCSFIVIRHQAGKAELKLTIIGPRGNSLPFTMNATALGEHVVYTPRDRGSHLIYVTYGGLDVPGLLLLKIINLIHSHYTT